MRSRLSYSSITGVWLLLACSEPPDINPVLEDYSIHLNRTNSLLCRCGILFGYENHMQCSEGLAPVGWDEWRCFTATLEGHEEAALDYLVCANVAYEGYIDCLEMVYICSLEPHEACATSHEAALAECPQLPSGVQSKFEACVD